MSASRKIGTIAVPLNYRLTPEEALYVINHSDAEIAYVDYEHAPMFAALRDQLDSGYALVLPHLAISDGGQDYGLTGISGTSVAAPLWAAVIALADQYAGRHLGFGNPALYHIAGGPAYQRAFHDITSGSNTVQFPPITIIGYRAGPGWDPVTGLGSPNAQALIPLLAHGAMAP